MMILGVNEASIHKKKKIKNTNNNDDDDIIFVRQVPVHPKCWLARETEGYVVFVKQVTVHPLHAKPCIILQKVFKRWSFETNRAGIWSFLYYRDKWYFFFPKIWSCHRRKMIFLKKIHGDTIVSSNVLKRWSFQKGSRWDMIFLVLSWKTVFYPKNMIFFPWTENQSWSFSRNTWKDESVYTYRCYKRDATPRLQKKSKMVLSRKNTPKAGWRYRSAP